MEDAMRSTGRRWWPLAAALVAVTLTAAMTACGDDDDDAGGESDSGSAAAPAEGGEGGDATLDVTEFQFSDVTVPAGGTLEVVNSSGGSSVTSWYAANTRIASASG